MRGSLLHSGALVYSPRSIPASAGQPNNGGDLVEMNMVYPRECGAALRKPMLMHWQAGLSPRVRGSRAKERPMFLPPRSIPASAGQPVGSVKGNHARAVYPRECGAAGQYDCFSAFANGLSPRVRGSLIFAFTSDRGERSIPASAGQP